MSISIENRSYVERKQKRLEDRDNMTVSVEMNDVEEEDEGIVSRLSEEEVEEEGKGIIRRIRTLVEKELEREADLLSEKTGTLVDLSYERTNKEDELFVELESV